MINLQPLYDVKARLEQAAIAGTGLLQEDFRLARAMEALTPLAKASPVFAKVQTSMKTLLEAPPETRNTQLLDVLSLVDAVVYTQGSTGLSGEISPLPVGNGTYCHISYLQLYPLLWALTSTGAGRIEAVRDAWKNHPEFFRDYRVFPVLIRALGDSYADLSGELIPEILVKMGPDVIPALKKGFDPAGKKEMVRRVQVIERIAGAKENDFYLEQLPAAKRDVKAALIYALRHDPGNVKKLLELCMTEKGTSKENAHWALAEVDLPEAWAYWEKLVEKSQKTAVKYLTMTRLPEAGKLIQRVLMQQIHTVSAPLHTKPVVETIDEMSGVILALKGKPADLTVDCWRQLAKLSRTCDPAFLKQLPKQPKRNVYEWVPNQLFMAILERPEPALLEMAVELWSQYGADYLKPALLAQILSQDSKTACQWARARLEEAPALNKKEHRKTAEQIVGGFLHPLRWISWNEERKNYEIRFPTYDFTSPRSESIHILSIPMLDNEWFLLLMEGWQKHKNNVSTSNGWTRWHWERLLQNLLFSRRELLHDPQLKKPLTDHLLQRLLYVNSNCTGRISTEILKDLIEVGWTDWKGVLPQQLMALHKPIDGFIHVRYSISELPLNNEEKVQELCEIDRLVREGKIKMTSQAGWPNPKQFRELLQKDYPNVPLPDETEP